jgi:hypothetical protein
MAAPPKEILSLQRPLLDDALRIVAGDSSLMTKSCETGNRSI